MGINVNKKKNVVILTVLDDIILDSIQDFYNVIDEQISLKNYFVVMDISGIEFITSRGLGAIGKVMDTLRKSGGDLKVCAMKPELKKIFDICGLSKILEIFDNQEDALLSCGENVGNIEKQLLWSLDFKGDKES